MELQQEFYDNIVKKNLSGTLCHYVWDTLICMNRGYGFNSAHTLGYSIVALQEANLAYHYPIIYWNTANLISDSGGDDSTVNYGKIAMAIGTVKKANIKVSLPDINRVKFDFHPDVKNNEIVYGLKPIRGIGVSIAKAIIEYQPYTSMEDFYSKMQAYKELSPDNKFGDNAMITLIKAGCFDELENKSREQIMEDFIRKISSPIASLKISNIEDLASLGLLTESQKANELRFYRFRNYVYQKKFFEKQTGKSPTTAYYRLDRKFAEPFFFEHFETNMVEGKDYDYNIDGFVIVKRGSLDREFKKLMQDFTDTVLNNPENLKAVNEIKFKKLWDEKVFGNISKWEMDSMCFYYHEHELANINFDTYNVSDFEQLPTQPVISSTYTMRDGKTIPRFVLNRICGTVLDKDKNKHLVTLLTPSGVVNVKFYKGQFGFYDKQISQVNSDGTKTVLEKSWFARGTKLLITGIRRGEQFVAKTYKDSLYKHSVQYIKDIKDNGDLTLISERTELD